ncbi:DNA polymerase I [Labilibaculum sp. A4]|uniref:DNA polymerase I n=1 Tax=Labilibaculum euxinus TaxID=2686357 RepID=UPI000F6253C9|nr:DNA polymerase I [Labilibaculum euxinus]MDQ1771770.1 DNA polymerase I [Labilibaculum euxinus]MWN77241.1 DNA polymerase I [Labilibaculum euxinus]
MNSANTNSGKKLFLLDAFALIYRSYYAFIKNPRFTSTGINSSAMLGFTNTLLEVLEKEKPSHIAVVFDPVGPTFRHDMFKDYKAQRPPMPEDLRKSIPYIKSIIQGFNIPEFDVEGYEADDVIGTLAKKAEKKGYTVYMMTPDKDYAQLVSENIFMFKPKSNGKEVEVWGVPEIKEKFGVEHPDQIVDYLGLMGDAADNIPGCPGIGPKTAQKLIELYKDIDGLYQNTDKLKGKQKEKIIESEEQVRFSKVLAKISLDAPIDFDEDNFKLIDYNEEALRAVFKELEFFTLAERVFKNQGNLFANESQKFTDKDTVEVKDVILRDINGLGCDFFVLDNQAVRADLKAELCVQKEYSFRTILSGSDPNTSNLLGLTFSYRKDKAFFVPFPQNFEEAKKVAQEFKFIFEDENILKIGHDIKRDILILRWHGIDVKGPIFDTMISHYLIQPELKHDFAFVAYSILNYQTISKEDKSKGKKAQLSLMLEPEVIEHESYCEETVLNLELKEEFEGRMKDNELLDLFYNIEMPLVSILADMEFTGVSIDVQTLKDYALVLNEEVDGIEKDIKEMAEVDFNVASPKQLGDVLFDKMGLDSKAKRTKSGQYSTSEDVLSKLKDKHEIIQKILDFRSLKKLISTYVEALPTYINEKSGKIHTSFNQAEAATGRLSSTNPNLQNIPIRTEQGRYIRKAFVPSSENHTFLSADYSQVELRLMAHMSQDQNMIDAFINSEDFHTATAAKIYKLPLEEVSKDMRSRAKTANFGIIYGISAWGLAERLSISRTEGKELITGYFESYPGVKLFMDQCVEKARENEFVVTLLSRRRYLKDINSSNAIVRGVAERNAVNAPIQGSAADVIKIAMINITKRMKREGMQSKLILQVHDELNFDCLLSELDQMKLILKEEMENAIQLSVPLTVDMGVGENWLEAH